MEVNIHNERRSLPGTNMKRIRFYYLNSEVKHQLEDVLQDFINGQPPQDLLSELNRMLPIKVEDKNSMRQRIEGMIYISERLWSIALEIGKQVYGKKFSRQELWRFTLNLPMSHYRYLTGSREPMPVLLTRDDALEDPSTAIVKLGRDIEALMGFILHTQDRIKGASEEE